MNKKLGLLLCTTLLAALVPATVATPAQAVQPVFDGYAWGWQPATPFYVANTGYEHNSAGGPIHITRLGVGSYQVRFLGMGGPGGVAHAVAYGVAFLCTVAGWGMSGMDEVVGVRCFTMDGAAVDSRFLVNVSSKKGARHGYLYSSDPMPPAAGYTPPAAASYDSAGQPIVVYRTGVGDYQVELGAFANDNPALWARGQLKVTPVSTAPRHCQVLDPALQPDPDLLEVRCYDDTGFGADTRFTLTYSRAMHAATATVDLSGMAPVVTGWSNSVGGAPTVTVIDDEGSYQVTFPNAAVPGGHAMGAIMGTPPMFCVVQSWFQAGTDLTIWLRCFDGGNGDPNPAIQFNLSFLT